MGDKPSDAFPVDRSTTTQLAAELGVSHWQVRRIAERLHLGTWVSYSGRQILMFNRDEVELIRGPVLDYLRRRAEGRRS